MITPYFIGPIILCYCSKKDSSESCDKHCKLQDIKFLNCCVIFKLCNISRCRYMRKSNNVFRLVFFCKRWKKKNTFFELKIPSLFFWTFFRVRMLSDDIFRIPEKKKRSFKILKTFLFQTKKKIFTSTFTFFFPKSLFVLHLATPQMWQQRYFSSIIKLYCIIHFPLLQI